jgi:hypothetical protein
MVLQLNLLLVAKELAGNKVIVICVKRVVATLCFIRKGIGKVIVLQNLRTVGYCLPRQAGQFTIYLVACCAVKVSLY